MSPIERAVRDADLGDARRNQRALRIVAGIVRGQTSDTNAATPSGQGTPWAHSMGAFRLFNSHQVSLPMLYAPVRSALAELVPRGNRALVVHDFSVLDYTKHNDKPDRVQVGNESGAGYDLYAALVLDPAGRPLGPVAVELRNARGCLSSESDGVIPFVDHLRQAERGVVAAIRHLPERELVHVADREFDDVLLQRGLCEFGELYVIRALQLGRGVLHDGKRRPLREAVGTLERRKIGTIERNGSTFDQYVAETVVVLDRPSLRGAKRGARPIKGEPIEVRVVVTELRGVDTKEHFEWILLTNIPDPVEHVVSIYVARWRIERLFYLAKVGLRLENWRQQTAEALARRLAVTMLAAMAVYQLQATRDEETLRAVGTLGGWLGRKNDALGPVILMRGMLVLLASLDAIAEHGVRDLVALAEAAGLGFAVPSELRPHSPARSKRPRRDV